MYLCNLIYIIYLTIFPLYLGYLFPFPIITMNNLELTISTTSCWWLQLKTAFKEKHWYDALPRHNLSFPTNRDHQKSQYSSFWGVPLGAQIGTTELMSLQVLNQGCSWLLSFGEFQRCSGGRWSLVSHGNKIKSKISNVSKTEFLSSHQSYH